jgi:hypothetical protein
MSSRRGTSRRIPDALRYYPVRLWLDDDGSSYRVQLKDGLLFKKLGDLSFSVDSTHALRRRIIRWLHEQCSFAGLDLGTVYVNSSSKRHPSCHKCRDNEGIIYKAATPICDVCGGAAIVFPGFADDPTSLDLR